MKYNRDMIIQKSLSENTGDYIFFWGHTPKPNKVTKACLSQWFDCCFTAKGIHYHTTEQYMMAQKALLFDDQETCAQIMASGYKAGESTCYFLRVQKDQKWGIVDTRGRRITPCKWDEIDDFGNCRAGDAWGFVNLLTMEETQPQWQYNQNLAPYEVIDHYEESIDYQGFGPSCAWSTTCTILNGNSM